MSARIAPASAPFSEEIQGLLDATMKGAPPPVLFTTLARDPRLFKKFFSAGLLDRGHLTMRQREIVINRTTALCGSEYEWGVHITAFAAHVKLTPDQIYSFVKGDPQDDCWPEDERLLLRLCDALHANCAVDDALWSPLKEVFSDEVMMELLMLAGFYRTVSYLTNALKLPLEGNAARFASVELKT